MDLAGEWLDSVISSNLNISMILPIPAMLAASEKHLQWPGEGTSTAHAPSLQDSCPVTSSKRVRIFSSKRFSMRSIADMRALSSWIYRKGERERGRQGKGAENRPATTARTVRKQYNPSRGKQAAGHYHCGRS